MKNTKNSNTPASASESSHRATKKTAWQTPEVTLLSAEGSPKALNQVGVIESGGVFNHSNTNEPVHIQTPGTYHSDATSIVSGIMNSDIGVTHGNLITRVNRDAVFPLGPS